MLMKKDYFFFTDKTFKTLSLSNDQEAIDCAKADPDVIKVICSDASKVVYEKAS